MPEILIQAFRGQQLRHSVDLDGQAWFFASDACEALGYSNGRDAIAKHVDSEDRNTVAFRDGIRGNPNRTVINESGLYALIFGSTLPAAREFKRWVTSEVLPRIRKTGSYHDPKTAARMEHLEAQVAQLQTLVTRLAEGREPAQVLPFRHPEPDPDWLTLKEAASEMGVTDKSCWRACHLGIFKRTRRGKNRLWLVHRSEVQRYLDKPFTLCRRKRA